MASYHRGVRGQSREQMAVDEMTMSGDAVGLGGLASAATCNALCSASGAA